MAGQRILVPHIRVRIPIPHLVSTEGNLRLCRSGFEFIIISQMKMAAIRLER